MLKKADNRSLSRSIARYSFIIYLFFIFFGTSLPFKEKITEVGEKQTVNVVNQFVFTTLFLSSCFCLYLKRREFIVLLRKEKYLTVFLVWCLLSLMWSDFPLVSFKRLFQVVTAFTVSSAVLLNERPSEEISSCFRIILYLFIPLSFISILFVHGAIDPTTLAWRGLAQSKNHLGQISLVSIIIWYHTMRKGSVISKLMSAFMLIISLVLLLGSESATSISTLAFLVIFAVVLKLDEKFRSLTMGGSFLVLVIVASLAITISIFFLGPEVIGSLFKYFGKDVTFTGRTDLWSSIFGEAKGHLLIGCGFAGFWVIDNPDLITLYKDFIWLPNQAHNGYLDILNETGLVGLSLFILMVVTYFTHAVRLNKSHFWKWFIIAALIINCQETTLFRQNILTGVMFIFCYLALYADLFNNIKEKEVAAING
ncbi:MAG: O-antigen ligase family protein [Desulfobacteraceae bacterium]|nr:O-antigen ligase family protein [Desulfobacteraceae bacterium]